MLEQAIQQTKGLGDNSISVVLLSETGYWDFNAKSESKMLVESCKLYLKERAIFGDELLSWYYVNFEMPNGGPYAFQFLNSNNELIGNYFASGLNVVGGVEPLTLADIERQTRIDDLSAEATEIGLFISAVREKGEGITRRSLVEKQQVLTLDGFPAARTPIELKNPPLQSIEAIKYIDGTGVEKTLDPLAYRVVFSTTDPIMPSYVVPIYGQVWPVALNDVASVTIEYTCGYTPETVPTAIKQWMLLNVASLYELRESLVVGNRLTLVETKADSLLDNYRVAGW